MRVSILIFGIVSLVTGSTFTYYKIYETNDDNRCKAGDEIITDENSNEAKCLGLCSLNSACRSVFMNTGFNSTQCYGCSRMYDDSTGLPSSPGTKHFEKPVNYMEACTIDRECVLEPNQTCNDNICGCRPGLPFDKASNSCVIECAAYGSDFQTYPQKALSTVDREVWGWQFSPDACKTHCASQSWCRGFDHLGFPSATCWFKDKGAATNPEHFNYNVAVWHYSRNCA